MYSYNKKILFSDIDASSNMSLYSIMNAMQDCVNINSESIGRGIDYMLGAGRTWFAIGWNIKIKRFPRMFEDVVVKTWPYDFGVSFGMRNIIIEDSNGEVIICADSIWTLVDIETGRPTKITEEDSKGYDLYERYDMEAMSRKIKVPKESEIIDKVVVRRSSVDYNGHMSNGEYIRLASDYLTFDKKITGIKVEYKTQAKLGEELVVKKYTEDNANGFIIAGARDDDTKAVVKFEIE